MSDMTNKHRPRDCGFCNEDGECLGCGEKIRLVESGKCYAVDGTSALKHASQPAKPIPMSPDEIAACKAALENRHHSAPLPPIGFETGVVQRLLATVGARDERIREAEELLEECTEFVEGEGFAGRVLAIRAFLGAKEG